MEILAIVAVWILGMALAWRSDRRVWNGGICRESGRPWVLFDTDSEGGRGYVDDPIHAPGAHCTLKPLGSPVWFCQRMLKYQSCPSGASGMRPPTRNTCIELYEVFWVLK